METTDYSGVFIYKDHQLDHILTDEGRLKWNDHDSIFHAEYFIKDHLGNVRSVISSDTNQYLIAQASDYYPFGMEISKYGSFDNQLKYNGKELQTEADLDWYDYGWRQYDPQLGRFHTQDRFSEKYWDFSPYQYAANNPVLFIDVNGDSLYVANNEDTHNDVKGLAKEKNQQYISINEDGSVTLDFSGVDAKTQKKAMKDKGLQLINNLVESKDADGNTENYYYEASNNREGVIDGKEFSISLTVKPGEETVPGDNRFVTNLSTTPDGVSNTHVTPANGYDGSVHISPGTMYTTGVNGNEQAASRSSLVYHELNENYNRTHKKMNYYQAHGNAGGAGTYTRFIYAPSKKK